MLFNPRIHVLPLREFCASEQMLRFIIAKRHYPQLLFLFVALLLRFPFLLLPIALLLRELQLLVGFGGSSFHEQTLVIRVLANDLGSFWLLGYEGLGLGFHLSSWLIFFVIHLLQRLSFLPVSTARHILASARYTPTSIFLLLLLFLLLDLLHSLFGFGLGFTLIFDALQVSFILL